MSLRHTLATVGLLFPVSMLFKTQPKNREGLENQRRENPAD